MSRKPRKKLSRSGDPSKGEGPYIELSTDLDQDQLTRIAQNVAQQLGLTFNFDEGSRPSITLHIAEAHMKDESSKSKAEIKVGDISGSTIGAIGVAGDISLFAQHLSASSDLEDELKRSLLDARQKLDEIGLSSADKEDVADNLSKLTKELEKSQPDGGLVRRFVGRIKEVATPVADVLSIAASISQLLG